VWDCGEQNGIGEAFPATISVLSVIIVSLLLSRPTFHDSTYKRIFPVVGGFCLKEVIVCSVQGRFHCSTSVTSRAVAHSRASYSRRRSMSDLRRTKLY